MARRRAPAPENDPSRPVRIFVSSTSKDLGDVHRRVVENLEASYGDAVKVVTMGRFTAEPEPPQVGDVEKVKSCDAFVMLLGWRYGTVPHGHDISHCEIEFNAAREHGLVCLIFEADAKRLPVVPGETTDDGVDWATGLQRVNTLKSEAKKHYQVAPFGPEDAPAKVNQAIREQLLPRFPSLEPSRRAHDALPRLVDGDDPRAIAYRNAVIAEHESVQLVGFPRHVRAPIRLEDLYVALKAVPDLRPNGRTLASSFVAADDADLRTRERDVPLSHAFPTAARYGNRRGVAILGDPGSGKTTQLRRMALACARVEDGPKHLGLPDDVLPAFLSLRRLQPGDDLDRDLAPLLLRSQETWLDPAVARWLLHERKRIVYLIDGLDEVPSERRADVSRWIERLRRSERDSFVAVTSRYAGYTPDARLNEHFLEMHLRPLEDEQIDAFIRNWNRIVQQALNPENAPSVAETAANDLIGRLRTKRRASLRLNQFASNPLLLTNICLVHRDRGLPEGRAALYEDSLEVLLGRWREAKKLPVQWTVDRAKQLLQPVALHLHRANKTRASAEELCPILEPRLQDVGWHQPASRFLELVRDDSGLLTGWSNDEYGFLHLGFQEYLTALEIARRATAAAFGKGDDIDTALADVVDQFGNPWWEEVVLLLLASRGENLFEPLFDRVVVRQSFGGQRELTLLALRESSRSSTAPFLRVLDGERPSGMEQGPWDSNRDVALEALRELDSDAAAERTPRTATTRGHRADTDRQRHEPSGIELVRIPGGRFWQGEDEPRRGVTWESPRHEVTVPEFWMAVTPVTNEQYRRFVEATGAKPPESWKRSEFNQPNQPVVEVSWDDAVAFCEWAGLRLPSESEWEYACRAGTQTHYWSGDGEEDLDRVGWFGRNAGGHPHPVRLKDANPFGLFDVHGNVWEWCLDETRGDLNSTADYDRAPRDGSPLLGSGAEDRVVRGGSWRFDAGSCRAASRLRLHRSLRDDDLGFRPASSPPLDFTTSPP